MASDPPQSDPFRVRLNWPEHDLVPATRRDQQPEEPASVERDDDDDLAPTPAMSDDAGDEHGSVLFTIASRLESLRAAMQNVTVRLDSLIRRDEQFREFTTARLAEQAEQIAIGVGAARGDIEQRAQAQDRAIGEVMSALDTNGQVLSDVTTQIERVSGRVERMADELASAVANLDARLAAATGEIDARVAAIGTDIEHRLADLTGTELTSALERVRDDMADLANRQQVEIEVIRAELVASIARTEARDEELSAEVSRMAEELRALRRRLPVAAKAKADPTPTPAPAPARAAPLRARREPAEPTVHEEDDDTTFRPRRRPLRARPE